jgi:hypothetical protein
MWDGPTMGIMFLRHYTIHTRAAISLGRLALQQGVPRLTGTGI